MIDVFKYYTYDWWLLSLWTIHAWLLTSKHIKLSFALGVLAAILSILFNFWIESLAGVVFNFVFLGIHLKNLMFCESLPGSSPSSSEDTRHICSPPSASHPPQAAETPE